MQYLEYLKQYHSTYKHAQILSNGTTFYTLGRVFRTLQGARMFITKNTI